MRPQRIITLIDHQSVIQINNTSGKQKKQNRRNDFMGNTPNFSNPEIPEILQTAVNNKSNENQNSKNGKDQQFMIRMELIGIKRFQKNNDKGQKKEQNKTNQYLSFYRCYKMYLSVQESHFIGGI